MAVCGLVCHLTHDARSATRDARALSSMQIDAYKVRTEHAALPEV